MTNPIIRIHDLETDELIEREMTDDELAVVTESVEQFEAEQAAKAIAKTEAEEKLALLGLTADDLKALGL